MTDVIVALFVFALIFIAVTAGNWAHAIIMGLIAVVNGRKIVAEGTLKRFLSRARESIPARPFLCFGDRKICFNPCSREETPPFY